MREKDKKNPEHEDPWLAFIREETPYLDDAGFSHEVMKGLPTPRRLRQWILAGSFIAAFFLLAFGWYLNRLPIVSLLNGIASSPALFWSFWVLFALILFVVIDERVAEES